MPTDKVKIIRTSTIPTSLNIFCRGLLKESQSRHGYEVIALSSSGDDLKEIADREAVKTIAVDMRRKISIINDIISLSKLCHSIIGIPGISRLSRQVAIHRKHRRQ